ncbi:MAG: WYL domain-containing protein [Anaerolineae bacterium]|nr:WYL domain-containing protein [Anaerolineae bacterium]
MKAVINGRGDRNRSWLVIKRGLALVRRLLRGPASKESLLMAINSEVGPDAYSEESSAAERAFKRDRETLHEELGVIITFDRRAGVYWLESPGNHAWLDLPDEHLAAMATIYQTFKQNGPDAERVRAFLDTLATLLPAERISRIERQRDVISVELRELDERPIPTRVMTEVRRAIAQRQQLSFNYRAAVSGHKIFLYHEVEPYDLVFRVGHWYLECFDLFTRDVESGEQRQDEHRYLRLQGIVDDDRLQVLPQRLPPGRRPRKLFSLRYRLAREAAHHGVSRHFPDMQIQRQEDGSVIVEAKTPDPWMAVRTLLGYGENCVVLGGEEALREMHRRVAGMAKHYDLLPVEVR